MPTANTLVNAPTSVVTGMLTRVLTYSIRPLSSGASSAEQVMWKGSFSSKVVNSETHSPETPYPVSQHPNPLVNPISPALGLKGL